MSDIQQELTSSMQRIGHQQFKLVTKILKILKIVTNKIPITVIDIDVAFLLYINSYKIFCISEQDYKWSLEIWLIQFK